MFYKGEKLKVKEEWKLEDGMYQCPECKVKKTKNGICGHIRNKHTDEGKKNNLILKEAIKKLKNREKGTYISPNKGKKFDEIFGKEKSIEIRKKISDYFKENGRTELTPEKETERRKKISESMKGNKNANHRGDRQSFYKDIRMDSRWEVGVAEYFDNNNIDWKYNEKSFILSDGRHYYPDFFIYKDNVLEKIVEVKGYFREENKKKFEKFLKEFKDLKVELWTKEILVELNILNRSGYLISQSNGS